MDQKNYIDLPLSFEYLMTFLFGKWKYHGYVGYVSRQTWEKDMLKVTRYIKKSILLNVSSDKYHSDQLLSNCSEIDNKIKSAHTISAINISLIEHLIKIIFLLIGNLPNHWRYKAPYKDSFWLLNGHRQLSYVQTDKQKTYLILNIIDVRKMFSIEIEEDYEDLHEVFWRKFKSNPLNFINWFREKYPDIYSKIF